MVKTWAVRDTDVEVDIAVVSAAKTIFSEAWGEISVWWLDNKHMLSEKGVADVAQRLQTLSDLIERMTVLEQKHRENRSV